jgi:hypothetical protein
MARRCDRCRAEYESGADFGGHDYCMTCYNIVKQEAERKLAQEERLRLQKEKDKQDYVKQQIHLDHVRSEQERQRRAHETETARLALAEQRKKPGTEVEELRKKKWPEIKHHYAVEGTAPLQIFTPLLRKRKSAAAAQKKKEPAPAGGLLPLAAKKEEKKKAKQAPLPKKQALSLSVVAGLPVSLSLGQMQIIVLFRGKNQSSSPLAVALETVALDSQKNRLQPKLEPRAGTIGPEAELEFKAELDLPEDVARGRLTLSALLKENAIYVDRPPAQSNTVTLSSQVKSPMDLQYVAGSARFSGGAILLSFRNVGESGGILEAASSLSYAGKGGAERKANLASRTKVKGGQKSVELSFSPAEPMGMEGLEISLAGKDSNGKPYALKGKIREKEEANPS